MDDPLAGPPSRFSGIWTIPGNLLDEYNASQLHDVEATPGCRSGGCGGILFTDREIMSLNPIRSFQGGCRRCCRCWITSTKLFRGARSKQVRSVSGSLSFPSVVFSVIADETTQHVKRRPIPLAPRRSGTRPAQKILTRHAPSAPKFSPPYAGPGCSSRCSACSGRLR